MTAVRILERVHRRAPFGLRLWDVALGRFVSDDGVQVDLAPSGRPWLRVRCRLNRSGVFQALDVPGLRDFELSDPETALPAGRPYRIEVRDPSGAFLPLAFDVDLPRPGPIIDLPLLTAPPRMLDSSAAPSTDPSSPAGLSDPPAIGVPLFTAPGRPVPEGMAVVRADVRELDTGRPAAWCLAVARVDGAPRGIGLADQDGRLTIVFPYPERAAPALASPAPARNDFRWIVELSAFYRSRPAGAPVADSADATAVLGQLAQPATVLRVTGSPPQSQPLQPQPLTYPVPLSVPHRSDPAEASPFLYLGTE